MVRVDILQTIQSYDGDHEILETKPICKNPPHDLDDKFYNSQMTRYMSEAQSETVSAIWNLIIMFDCNICIYVCPSM